MNFSAKFVQRSNYLRYLNNILKLSGKQYINGKYKKMKEKIKKNEQGLAKIQRENSFEGKFRKFRRLKEN